MPTFLTSDQHFQHRNIIDYSARPFRDVEHMNEELVRRHNDRVKPEDLVLHLGDFSLNEGAVPRFLPRLNGRHVLVCGNHDACHPSKKGWRSAATRYVEYGFLSVQTEMRIRAGKAGMDLRLHHMPYRGDSSKVERYREWRPEDNGMWLLHGHVHEAWKCTGRQLNIGVDQWGWAPVSLSEVCDYIRAREEVFGAERTD